MIQVSRTDQRPTSFLAGANVGNAIAIAATLSFIFLCMIFSLVGPSGAATPYAGKNFAAFLVVLIVSLALSVLAVLSKMRRRQGDGSPLPRYCIGLAAVCTFILAALLMGLLKI